MAGKGGGIAKKKAAAAGAISGFAGNFPVYFVLVCCALFALQLGIDRPWFSFQKSPLQEVLYEGCNATPYFTYAFASGSSILLPTMQSGKTELVAAFEGSGSAERVEVLPGESGLAFSSLRINGIEACAPCAAGRQHLLSQPQQGRLLVEATVEKQGEHLGKAGGLALPQAFFEDRKKASLETQLMLRVGGGWRSAANQEMPSSFYGVDAPFHINRVPVLAGYLASFRWPSAGYSFLSGLAPAIFYMASGLPYQHAYKAWEILLFFVPVAIFYLFSRKLSAGKDATFLFASLLYLYLPANGLPLGGGPDLFFYGMTAHTLGTYLSLLSFYFAYGFAFEGKRGALAAAVLFFALAFFSNPRILLSLGMGLGLLLAVLFSQGRWRRAAVLGAGCLSSVAWFAVPYAQAFSFASYGPLEGVGITSYLQGPLAILQAGFVILPLLFAAGAYAAWRKRELFPIALAGWGVLVFLFSASPDVNRLFPAVDGLRFLPSFFLPAMFVAGMGAHRIWEWIVRKAREAAGRRGMEADTVAVALGLALLLPLAAAAGVAMQATTQQYSGAGDSLAAAYDFDSQLNAYRMTGDERVLFVSYGEASQYPAFEEKLQGTTLAAFGSPQELAALMKGQRLRLAILGNSRMVLGGEKGRLEEYRELEGSPLFEQLLPYGGARVFALRGGEEGRQAFANGVEGFQYEVQYDSARLGGTCARANCSALVFSPLGEPIRCQADYGPCSARRDEKSGGIAVEGIPGGKFVISLSPGSFGYESLLGLLCAAVLAACLLCAGKIAD